MEAVILDYTGQETYLDDTVLIPIRHSKYPTAQFIEARVRKINPKSIRVSFGNNEYLGSRCYQSDKFIKIKGKKNAGFFEAGLGTGWLRSNYG